MTRREQSVGQLTSLCATSSLEVRAVRIRALIAVTAVVVTAGVGLSACGSSSPPNLKPSALGSGKCQAATLSGNAGYGQFATSEATCTDAETVAAAVAASSGTIKSDDGYSCTAKTEGPGTTWAASFGGTYKTYRCTKGSNVLAFNWGLNYIYGSAIVPQTPVVGTLEPSALGAGECQAADLSVGSVFAQIDASHAACSTATDLADQAATAQGSDFAWNGFRCTSTSEGAGSTWASAWTGAYDAYTCADGDEQVAFNWGLHYLGT
jgi:hypothetical protein